MCGCECEVCGYVFVRCVWVCACKGVGVCVGVRCVGMSVRCVGVSGVCGCACESVGVCVGVGGGWV